MQQSNAATSFDSDVDSFDDAFRSRILMALRDVRRRERRASAPALSEVELRLGDAANDDLAANDSLGAW